MHSLFQMKLLRLLGLRDRVDSCMKGRHVCFSLPVADDYFLQVYVFVLLNIGEVLTTLYHHHVLGRN